MLMQARNGNYAGARLEDIIVVDQEGTVRYATNMLGVYTDYTKINRMVDALINRSAIIDLSLRQLYFGTTLEVGQSRSTTLKISNVGEGPLEITGYTAPEGITMEPAAVSLAINETKSVKITFTPIQSGPLSGSFTLDHNDPKVGPLQVPILDLTIEPGEIPIVVTDPRTDFDGSGTVDFPDFLAFVKAFGTADASYDLDDSNQVDFGDFLIFAQNFGKVID
jgi:hypothetical protein